MISRFATVTDDEFVAEREERFTIGKLISVPFSMLSIGITSYMTIGIYGNVKRGWRDAPEFKKYWDKYPSYIKKLLSRPMPWERAANNASMTNATISTLVKPQSILNIGGQYKANNYTSTFDMMTVNINQEISELTDALNADNVSRIYLDKAREEIDKHRISTINKLGSIDTPDYRIDTAQKYRNMLRKYKALYDRNSDSAVGSSIADENSKVQMHKLLLKESDSLVETLDTTQLKYRNIEPHMLNMPDSGITSIGAMVNEAHAQGKFKWEIRNMFSQIPGYRAINIARTEDTISRIYDKLLSEVRSRAQQLKDPSSMVSPDDLAKVEQSLVKMGDGSVSVRFLVRMKNETATTIYGKDMWVTDELLVPLGNTGKIAFEVGGTKYIGPLYKKVGSTEWLDPASQYARTIENSIPDIVNGMITGDDRWRSDIRTGVARHITMSQGALFDKGIMMRLDDEDMMRLNPAYNWDDMEKEGVRRELYDKTRELSRVRHAGGDVKPIESRIRMLKMQLGIGYDEAAKMLEMQKLMRATLDTATGLPLFHEVSATHMGSMSLWSIFGNSPYAIEANPQSSPHQFYNTYELTENITKTSYPIRYSGMPILPQSNFVSARTAFINMYPLNESQVFASDTFLNTIKNNRALGTGEKSSIVLDIVDGKVQLDGSNQPFKSMVKRVLGVEHGNTMLDAERIYQEINDSDIRLNAGEIVGRDANNEPVRAGKYGSRVVNITRGRDKLIVEIENVAYDASRLRSLVGGAKGTALTRKYFMTNSEGYIDSNSPLDMVIHGRIGKRMTMHGLYISVVANAVEDVRIRNRKLIQLIWRTKSAPKLMLLKEELAANKSKLAEVAGLLGGHYNATDDSISDYIDLPGIYSTRYRKMEPHQVSTVLQKLGRVYKPGSKLDKLKTWYSDYAQAAIDDLTDDVETRTTLHNLMRPEVGKGIWWDLVIEGKTRYVSIIGLDLVGLMRQIAEDMYKVFGIKAGPEAGIPFRYTEIEQILQRYMTAPLPVRDKLMTPLEKYANYLTGRLGGPQSMEAYYNILSKTPPPGTDAANILVRGTEAYDELMNKHMLETRIPSSDEVASQLYILENGTATTNMDDVIRERADGRTVRKVPSYKLAKKDLGIFDPDKGYYGKWVELPWELEYRGITGKYLYIPQPGQLKHNLVHMGGPGAPYTYIPAEYRYIYRILDQAADATKDSSHRLAQSNYTRMANAHLKDLFVGKSSVFRRKTAMAWESGMQGIVTAAPRNVTMGGESYSVTGTIDATNPLTGERVRSGRFFSKYKSGAGFYDAITGHKSLREMRDSIMNVLIEKHNGDIGLAREEYKLIARGEKPIEMFVVRHPKTGPQAGMPVRVWFDRTLRKQGYYGDFFHMSEMLQKSLWADWDADLAQFALAAHYDGHKGLEEFFANLEHDGNIRVMEGTLEYKYLTGEENVGSGMKDRYSVNSFADDIDVIKEGKRKTTKVPKVYYLKPIDKQLGYHIYTHKVYYDDKLKAHYITPEIDIFKDVDGPVVVSPDDLIQMAKAAIEEGKQLNPNEFALLNKMDPAVVEKAKAEGIYGMYHAAYTRNQNNLFAAMMAQKGFAGSSTSRTMALNLLAAEHLPREESAMLSQHLSWWIQNSLQMKKATQTEINEAFHKYGTFSKAIQGMSTVDDIFGKILTGDIDQGGWGMPREAAEAIAKIPISKRSKGFPDAGITYKLLRAASNNISVEDIMDGLKDLYDAGLPGTPSSDIHPLANVSTLMYQLRKSEVPKMTPEWARKGYFKRKPFMGNIFKPTWSSADDTILNNTIGANAADITRGALVGTAFLGGLYLAINLFRPNQMRTLDTMSGLGGEFWGPMRGRRTELPYRVPIDVNEYTWTAPPYDKKAARIDIFDPINDDKMDRVRGKLNALIGSSVRPNTNWTIPPRASTINNSNKRSNRPFSLDDAIRSSDIILAK